MSIPVHLFSLFLRSDNVTAHYPGGLEQFCLDFPLASISEGLVHLYSMSGQDIDEDIRRLDENGLDTNKYVTFADMMGGELQGSEGIALENESEDLIPPNWRARATGS